jgi:hypothetical protein
MLLGPMYSCWSAIIECFVGCNDFEPCPLEDPAVESFPFQGLPLDLQIYIVNLLPLRKLAQLASASKGLHTMYSDRVSNRDAVVAALLEGYFSEEFRQGLSTAAIALPRDLVVDTEVRGI